MKRTAFALILLASSAISAQPPSPATPPAAPVPRGAAAPASVYEVYQGCEKPASTYARTVTVDPKAGDTLEALFSAKKVLAGDHLILLPGDHGAILAKEVAAGAWIWLDFQPGATAKSITLKNISKILITGAEITSPTGKLFFASAPAHDIVLADSQLYGARDSKNWSAAEWLAAPNAIQADNVKNVSILRNAITNVRFGISASSRQPDVEGSRMNVLIKNNLLKGVSGDFIRPIGGNMAVIGNKGIDGYLSAADGDGNHDDFIQMFALPLTAVYDNVLIEGNYFCETTDVNRKFNADYQGISCFDGTYTNVTIRGNTVLASAYWGIAMYGGKHILIERNTVLSIRPRGDRKLRIAFMPMKRGAKGEDQTARDNVANVFLGFAAPAATSNNIAVPPADASTAFVEFNLSGSAFDLHPKKGGALDGKHAGALQSD